MAAVLPSPGPASAERPQSKPSAHPFTCNSCQVAFRSSDLQRTHMRTDWHRYNIKRRVASLPPISAELFNEKVMNAQADSREAAAKASFERNCTACQRTYYSPNAFSNHVQSQKHRLREALLAKDGLMSDTADAASLVSASLSLGDPIPTMDGAVQSTAKPLNTEGSAVQTDMSEIVQGLQSASVSDNYRPTLTPTQDIAVQDGTQDTLHLRPSPLGKSSVPDSSVRCLFCSNISSDTASSLKHMSSQHGLFIPEQDYLVDLDGLLKWLRQRIEEDHECLYCHKLRHSAEAIQTHMKDVGHCKIAYEEEEDMILVGQYYDFTSTYSDDEEEGSNTNDAAQSKAAGDDDWESDSDVDSVEADEHIEVTAMAKSRKYSGQDTLADHALVMENELYLPSGKVAGHRSLAKYFRQNLHSRPLPSEVAERGRQGRLLEDGTRSRADDAHDATSSSSASRTLITRENGGMLGVTDAKKREVRATERRDQHRAQRAQKQYAWGLQRRANNQRHFRDPLLQ